MVRIAGMGSGVVLRRTCLSWARTRKSWQRVLRHAQPHHIKAFDPAVIAAMKTSEATLDTLKQSAAIVQQAN